MDAMRKSRVVFVYVLMGAVLAFAGNAAALSSTPDVHVPQTDGTVGVIVQSVNTVYVGGSFTQIGGVARNNLAAFDATTGVVDPAWDPNLNSSVGSLAVSGGKVYAGGSFTTVNGGATTRNRLAAFNLADGTSPATVDPAWDPSMDFWVSALAVSGGYVYVGGAFSTVNGGATTRNRLAAFNLADGTSLATVDAAWDPSMNGSVNDLAVSGGKVYAGGSFQTVNGGAATRIRLAAFNLADGTSPATPDAWDPNAGFGGVVIALASSGSGGVLAGGSFTTMGGSPQNYLAGFGTSAFMPVGWISVAVVLLAVGLFVLLRHRKDKARANA